ncbi:MAG: 3-phosphoserine/phosphohydroxythreonine transaminase [Anaerolineae bacterium]|nr:3-phosphoserine/phosphohydroxythreonine transaminase [Anaerolineae bacterium]
MYGRVFNFNPGPAALPVPVLEQVRDELLNFSGTGMSVMEMSHRSKAFAEIVERAEGGFRRVMGIPDEYAVLFLQGGASLQFAMVPMNLALEGKPVDVIDTGNWTQKAIGELEKLASYRIAASTAGEGYTRLPRREELDLHPDASYVYMASNNTIRGTQWAWFPDTGDVPLVADMSSDILSRPVDVSQFGLIFAGAQKNAGPAGVTIVIVRKDLAERASKDLPTMLQYRTHIGKRSLFNTPPTFGIYVVSLVLDWVEREGGLAEMARRNEEKAELLYSAIDASAFYECPVEESSRSRMNVVFRIRGGDEELEKRFASEAEAAGLVGVKGHRSVGGLRASLYNAQTVEGVRALVDFMKEFEQKYG